MDSRSVSLYHILIDVITWHYDGIIMGTMASQITSLTIVYSTVHSGADQRKHQSSAALAFVRGIHREPVNSPHKWPVTQKMFPFDDVIMETISTLLVLYEGNLPSQKAGNMALWIFFGASLNKLLKKQSSGASDLRHHGTHVMPL